MKQLVQKLLDGKMAILEVPTPMVGPGMVLVANHYSLISVGTEKSLVTAARDNLIAKARKKPQQVRQVLDTLATQGPVQTYRAVMKKLDSYSPLGYSTAGVVLAVGEGVRGFRAGDPVACAGAGYANHAEVVVIPENLCVRLPEGADLALAAYNTVGAIALQGVRQADLRVGETCVVIGIGLLGHLTALILRASGVRVLGVDVRERALELGRQHCLDDAAVMSDPSLKDRVMRLSAGVGADAVIITAATRSLEPINLAGQLLRKRGTVVIVGDVPTGFQRDPDFYRKELTVRMSCSYGPGRYDLEYEEKGYDYPPGYVRWTENRNMQAFQDLLHSGRIDASYLTSHRFAFDHATDAYDMIVKGETECLGVMLEYTPVTTVDHGKVAVRPVAAAPLPGVIGVGFIGAGSYALGHLLPHISGARNVALTGVMTASGNSSRGVAEKYGFGYATGDGQQVLDDAATNAVFIATRHESHGEYVLKALAAGKHVFVEKPLCVTEDELRAIEHVVGQSAGGQLLVGLNRRFAPLAVQARIALRAGSAPMAMVYRVNAGQIPAGTWIQDPELGGGRIIGEACHFIDFMTWMNGSLPVSVHALSLRDPQQHDDTVTINLGFANGSIGTLNYFANGAKKLPKERVELYLSGQVAVIDDFRELTLYQGSKQTRDKRLGQDKGQGPMVQAFLGAVAAGGAPVVPFEEIRAVTAATFAAMRSLRSGIGEVV
ncbi:MAG: oxidoreductase [Gammaproteobacteria bacterium PRO9]|nr:oxidoreductase [Gammaproteobacteria bacterium PRO9]